jgi:cytochrome c peroxidase
MLSKLLIVSFLTLGSVWLSSGFKQSPTTSEKVFRAQIAEVIKELESFDIDIHDKAEVTTLKEHFLKTRLAFKRSSILVDYFFPSLRRDINGPDLKYAEEDNPLVIHAPHGFQVIERTLYGSFNSSSYHDLSDETGQLITIFKSIRDQPELSYKFRDEYVFDAMKMAVIRLVALGITGFDSPVALNSLAESSAVLTGISELCEVYKEDKCKSLAIKARDFISNSRVFDSFDRLKFISENADPLYGQIVRSAIASGYLLPVERRPLNQLTTSIFSDSLFNIDFYSPNERYRMTPDRVSLGRSLFYDSIFSMSVKRSCATCHDPAKSFTDGLKVPVAINKTSQLKRNTPTLAGAAFQTRFFYDSRASTLENQLNSVVHNINEMNGSLNESIERIKNHDQYFNAFRKSYPNEKDPVTQYNIANAISSYVRSLGNFNTKFDKYLRGEATLSSIEKKGFNLFAGKAKCATCHYIPLFNGLVPPQFTETESEVLGVPSAAGEPVVDADEGKFIFTRSPIHKYAFKTPTLRNVTRTAPYMHNGVFKTLEQVMDFYNKGGGAGLNIHLDNQTLPADKLQLSRKEIKCIIAFLGTLEG